MSVAEKIEFLLWEKRCKEVEWDTVSDELRCATVDILDADKREVLVTNLWRFDFSGYSISCLKRMLLDLVL